GGVAMNTTLVEQAAEAATVRFEVVDTGIGIAPEALGDLFQPFAQGDPSTARQYGGTGLGLAICKRLGELMGGGIGVESGPGRGSLFGFTGALERASERASGEAAAEPVSAGATGPTSQIASPPRPSTHLLVADDSRLNQQVARGILEQLGYSADVVGNGREAL